MVASNISCQQPRHSSGNLPGKGKRGQALAEGCGNGSLWMLQEGSVERSSRCCRWCPRVVLRTFVLLWALPAPGEAPGLSHQGFAGGLLLSI